MAASNRDSTVSGLLCLFLCSLAVRDSSKFNSSERSNIKLLLKWYCEIAFGELGEGNAEPSGLPYQITGTLNGLPPCPGRIFLDRYDRAG